MASKVEYAHSRIVHGKAGKDGKVVETVVEENEVVPDNVFTDEELETLRAATAIAPQPKSAKAQADALTEAQAEVARLKEELAKAQAKPATPAGDGK